jgi:hypothetical protein
MSSGCCIDREDCWISWEEEAGESVPVLNFSPGLVEQLGWDVGDELYWEQIKEDPVVYSLRKIEDGPASDSFGIKDPDS